MGKHSISALTCCLIDSAVEKCLAPSAMVVIQVSELGTGAFAVVVKALDMARGGEPVAIKLLERGSAV